MGHKSNEVVKMQAKGNKGHNREQLIKSAVQRFEAINEEIAEKRDEQKDICSRIKDELGISIKAFKEVVRRRKMETDTLSEFVEEVNDIQNVLGMFPGFYGAELEAQEAQADKVGTQN